MKEFITRNIKNSAMRCRTRERTGAEKIIRGWLHDNLLDNGQEMSLHGEMICMMRLLLYECASPKRARFRLLKKTQCEVKNIDLPGGN